MEEAKQTYSQNWQAYDRAQCSEKTLLMPLLVEFCKNIGPEENSQEEGPGRPSAPLSDMLFSAVFKVYSSRSLRRFMGDLRIAKEKGYISKLPCFASIGHFLQKGEITPILHDLIIKSSLPLKAVETDFAVDSSGFSTTRFGRYYDFKHGKDNKYRKWVKIHIITRVKTNIITGIKITEENANDAPHFRPLVEKTARNFRINEVSADKAYSSRENLQTVSKCGGMAFIPFRKNATGKSDGSYLWKRMYHYFMFNQEEFMKYYHKRSNVETTFHMIKAKFGDSLKSKTKTAQVNEVLCKVLCHNLCVLIHEMHELESNLYHQNIYHYE